MFNLFLKVREFFKEMLLEIIKANLNDMFGDINTQVSTIATNVGTTPKAWNTEVFSFIERINTDVIVPIAVLILTAIMCVELIQMVIQKNNMSEIDTFDFFKYIIKMWVAIYLLTHSFEFAMAVFDVAQTLSSKAAGIVNTTANVTPIQIDHIMNSISAKSLEELTIIALEVSVVKLIIVGISVLITVILYGRMIEIYIYSSVAAIPFSTMGNKEWGQIGNNYIKGLFALGLQGVFLIICVGIYAVLVKTMSFTDIHLSTMTILGYTLILGFSMLKVGTVAKSILNAH